MASMVEHTFLMPHGTPGDMVKLCEEAKENRFIGVCVNPWEIGNCVGRLEGSGVIVVTVIGFPLGQNTTSAKECETKDAIQRGAKEIDMVINVRALQAGAMEVVSRDVLAVVRACEAGGAAVEDVRLIRSLIRNEMGLKAAGGYKRPKDGLEYDQCWHHTHRHLKWRGYP
jgi:deoxyribose-phosphate aldolase